MSTEQDPTLPINSTPLNASSQIQTPEIITTVKPAVDLVASEIRNALHGEQYIEAITRSSASVNDLCRLTAELIELRACAFEKTCDMKSELRDALFLTKLDPQNVNGYLRAAKLYSIQGKQMKAIAILKSGIISACPSITQKLLLQQQISQAQDRLRSRVDFIARAPYDILCNILDHLTYIGTSLTCITVSSVWRKKLLQCPVQWRSIDLDQLVEGYESPKGSEQATDGMIKTTISLLPLISQHIQHVKVDLRPEMMKRFLQGPVLYNFSSLCSLRITVRAFTALEGVEILTYPLYAVLPHISQTLTALHICDVDVSLGRIIAMCPNLTTLFAGAFRVTGVSEDFPPLHTTSLTTLRVGRTSYYNKLTATELAPILQHSPELRCLQLYCAGEDVLTAVRQHCPGLEIFETTHSNLEDDDYINCVSKTRLNERSNGLRILSLSHVSAQSLQCFLENGADNLSELYLEAVTVETPIDSIPSLGYSFHNLITLSITELRDSSPIFLGQISAILRTCPVLRCLQMKDWHQYDDRDTAPSPTLDSIFNAIAKLDHLRYLHLENFDVRSESFDRLVGGYATQGNRNQLLELHLVDAYGLTIANLDRISKITSLKTLRVTLPDEITVSTLTRFTRRIGRLPELYILQLANSCQLSMEAAQYLVSSRTLTHLITFNMEMSSEVKALIEDSQINLEEDPDTDDYL